MQLPNRHQRRSIKHALARSDYATPTNGVTHDALTGGSFAVLCRLLQDNGNVLSEEHQTALYALCGLFTKSAQHKLTGRWAFGLPTGMGKTSAIVAWCATLVAQGHDHISVAVSASKVEALCDLKRALIRQGVPEERIGLLYADGGRYSMPRTLDNEDRQIMLVSHARVRMGTGLERFNRYRGKPRDLLVYDESLITSDAKGISALELKGAAALMAVLIAEHDGAKDMLAYVSGAVSAIDAALARAKTTDRAQVIQLPQPAEGTVEQYRALVPKRASMAPIETLLDLAHEDLRVVSTSEGGAVWYDLAVPRELHNVLVLDASYSIRELCLADASIRDAEKHLDAVKRIGVPLSHLKDYSAVELRQLFVSGGRHSMERDYSRDPWDRKITKEIVEVVKAIPEDEAVLVFVFKPRASGPDFGRLTLSALAQAGIDVRAQVTALEHGKEVPRDRINVVTWGMETSLNCYAHCRNVILAGVLHRSTLDLAGLYLGQRDNLTADLDSNLIHRLVRSEVCHCIYQALSRGSCRVINNGKAEAMRGWIIHKDLEIQRTLSSVMPGAVWSEWATDDQGVRGNITSKTAHAILAYLKALPDSVDKVSSRKLKDDLGLANVVAKTFTRSLTVALSSVVGWQTEGRSLVRVAAS
ncbi:hypothetical protein [Reyranella sp.]|uniref:hypothetical protein n=1 Tax=Reyranella sp. TaxID=1929291 RepID=UPI003D118AF3